MNTRKGSHSNPSISKGGDNFFVTKTSVTKPSSKSRSDNFFVQKKGRGNVNLDEEKKKVQGKRNASSKIESTGKNIDQTEKHDKKPFDKKRWRLKTYSKKYKLEKWEEKRKNAILKDYHNQTKDDAPKLNVQKIYGEYAEDIEMQIQDDEHKTIQMQQDKQHGKAKQYENQSVESKNTKFSTVEKYEGKFKKIPFKKARLEFEKNKSEKESRKQEAVTRKTERDAALKQYKEKKIQKFKKLNQKTKKGQPIMKARIEMLLEQIQASKASEK